MKRMLIIIVCLAASSIMFSQGFKHQKRAGQLPQFNVERMAKHLELNDEQSEKLKTLRSDAMKQNIKLRADLKLLQIEKKELIDSESINMNSVESKIDQIAELRKTMELNRIKNMQAVKQVLTKEQFTKLKEMKQKKGKRSKRHKKRYRDN